MSAITIEEALKKYDRRLYNLKLSEEKLNIFRNNVKMYINKTSKAIADGETEEHLKNITNDFMKESFYHSSTYEINTDKRIDSVIKANGEIRVLIENKNPKNVSEMVSSDNVNVKALHEIIFYYMTVTRDTTGAKVKRNSDVEVRRVVITDTVSFAVIDANEIEKIVDGYLEKHFYKYQNRQLIYSNNADKFYTDIKQYLDTLDISKKLPYVYFKIADYLKQNKSAYLYKFFNKNYLLKDNSKYNESIHTLNE